MYCIKRDFSTCRGSNEPSSDDRGRRGSGRGRGRGGRRWANERRTYNTGKEESTEDMHNNTHAIKDEFTAAELTT